MTKQIPTSWKDVKVGTFQELSLLDREDPEYNVQFVSVLTGIPFEELRKMSKKQLADLNEKLTWSNRSNSSQFETTFEIKGVKYGIVPDLNDMTVGEWLDIKKYCENPIENLHLIVAVLYRPEITNVNPRVRFVEPYDYKTVADRGAIFQEELSIQTVHGATLFFSLIGTKFVELFHLSLPQQLN